MGEADSAERGFGLAGVAGAPAESEGEAGSGMHPTPKTRATAKATAAGRGLGNPANRGVGCKVRAGCMKPVYHAAPPDLGCPIPTNGTLHPGKLGSWGRFLILRKFSVSCILASRPDPLE